MAMHLKAGQAASLGDVGGAIEDGVGDAVPVLDDLLAIGISQLLRHNRPAQPHTCEACVLAEGAGLHAACLSPCSITPALQWQTTVSASAFPLSAC